MFDADSIFNDRALDTFEFEVGGTLKLAAELERAHAAARGIEAVIRLVRASAVQSELGNSSPVNSNDADALLALAGQAAGMLAERAEDVSDWAANSPCGDASDGVSTQHNSLCHASANKDCEVGSDE